MRILSYLVLLVIMLAGLTFTSLNSVPVSFNYYLDSKTFTLSLLLVFAFGGGIFLGLLASIFSWINIKRDNFRLKSRLKLVEKEVKNLRSIPIKGE
ncbi:MAG: LapA family protein [bacterium]